MFNRELSEELRNVINSKDQDIKRLHARIQQLEDKLMSILDPEALKTFRAIEKDRTRVEEPRVPLVIGEDGEARPQTAADRAKVIQGMQELGIM